MTDETSHAGPAYARRRMSALTNSPLRIGPGSIAVVLAAATLVLAIRNDERGVPGPAGPVTVDIDAVTDPVGVRIGTSGPGLVVDATGLAPLIALHFDARDELCACIDDARRIAASDPGPVPC